MGKAAGDAVLAKYGPEYFRELGRRGGETLRDHGFDYAEIGAKGGQTTKARHGSSFYAEIGRKGGAKAGRRHA